MTNLLNTNVLLADDDRDDCLLSSEALAELSLQTSLTIVNNGEELMNHLKLHLEQLPDMLFLDMNMPRKNGAECLLELQQDQRLRSIPVIIMSTFYDARKAIELYKKGAQHFICKPPAFAQLKIVISNAFVLIQHENGRSAIDNFLINQLSPAC